MDRYLQSNLKIIKDEAIPNKWDSLSIFFGREGAGKSTIAAQCCKELDSNFGVDNIVFTVKQFEEACENLPSGSAILWDEAITGANAMQHASKISQSIISRLTQIRKKGLKIALCFPYLHMLNKYFISRCLFSVYVYAKDFNDRGHGFFYDSNKTEYLYNMMKTKYSMFPKRAIDIGFKNFYFLFGKRFPVDESLYDDKKEAARNSDEAKPQDKWKEFSVRLLKIINNDTDLSVKDLAVKIDKSRAYLHQLMSGYS